MSRRIVASLLAGVMSAALYGFSADSRAQPKYPTRPINVVVPFTPGGSTDLAARAMATFLQKKWGVAVNVVNKPGGNTIPGTLEVYTSPRDGYTILADGLPRSARREGGG